MKNLFIAAMLFFTVSLATAAVKDRDVGQDIIKADINPVMDLVSAQAIIVNLQAVQVEYKLQDTATATAEPQAKEAEAVQILSPGNVYSSATGLYRPVPWYSCYGYIAKNTKRTYCTSSGGMPYS